MAVYFAPQRKDPNAELKQYMMMMAQMLGGKRRETKQQQKALDFAKSLSPPQIPSAGGQGVFTPGGAEALTQGWLGGQPTKTGMIQGAQLTPMKIMQKALTSGLPMREAIGAARLAPTAGQGFTLGPGQTRFGPQGKLIAKLAPTTKPTKVQELVSEGYTREEARMIRDISHGLKPRASARKKYNNMDDVEKMGFLSTLKQRAEGQYYGIEGGNIKPRQPKLLKWVDEELGKLSALQTGVSVTPKTGEPQSQDEFFKTVQSIVDDKEAKTYYEKWVGKWQ